MKGFQAGTVKKRALEDAVFNFLVISEELAWNAAQDAGVDLANCRARRH